MHPGAPIPPVMTGHLDTYAPNGVDGNPGFHTRISDCCAEPGGCGRCLYVACCPSCAYGQDMALMDNRSYMCAGSCCGSCFLYFAVGAFPVVVLELAKINMMYLGNWTGLISSSCVVFGARRALRRKYGLQEPNSSALKDICLTTFCQPCVLCQQGREIAVRKFAETQQQQVAMYALRGSFLMPAGGGAPIAHPVPPHMGGMPPPMATPVMGTSMQAPYGAPNTQHIYAQGIPVGQAQGPFPTAFPTDQPAQAYPPGPGPPPMAYSVEPVQPVSTLGPAPMYTASVTEQDVEQRQTT
ncbi:hypothetical protein CYMTET_26466 [Cymbomonas tetramitiformis]|uniref:Uncharacterized protein n=1 Tax=Cymbomonas tetramitiformis TaxID=36881 RepID=A0AAE0KY75_9CHLO|nr:hypothetical protein CYMTET_26466 [Cymbomonas tetramitiformis]